MTDPAIQRATYERRFIRLFAIGAAIVSLMPFLLGLLLTPVGSRYVGYQTNLDDHMVYAAWMRQAMDGRILFDNRFAVDPQPGLTLHLYFFALGLLAKVVSIPWATALSKAALSAAFIVLLGKLVKRVSPDVFTTKLGISLATFGGGLGYLVWQNFGQLIEKPALQTWSGIMDGRLPTDVWQPEGYVFSSMLTNSLFMAALCLILVVFLAALSAKESGRRVWVGALAMFLLMNIHSYDAALVVLVFVGLLVASLFQGQVDRAWVLRVFLIGLGAVPSALWFVYVYRHDTVFQQRAATLTYAPAFHQVFFGYLPLLALGLVAVFRGAGKERKARLGAAILAILILFLFVFSAGANPDRYFMTWAGFLAALASALVVVALRSETNPAWNLILAWASIGLVAPYLPELFQRKLSMGLAIPWAILAALGFASLVRERERSSRNLATLLAMLLVCGTAPLWLFREYLLAKDNVSSTTRHAVYLSADAAKIVDLLQSESHRHTVVLAHPGIALPAADGDGKPLPAEFVSPYIPDLNPVLSGLSGVYTYAGHWSETPDYGKRHDLCLRVFMAKFPEELRSRLIQESRADYIVAPIPEAFPEAGLADLRPYGDVVFEGSHYRLIRTKRS